MIIYANKASLEDALKGTSSRLIVEKDINKMKDAIALYSIDELQAMSDARSASALEQLAKLAEEFLKTYSSEKGRKK